MATWHETMMKSSDSFRECHESKNVGNDENVSLIDDYISISYQGMNNGKHHYWSIYEPATPLEVGKCYELTLNDGVQTVICKMHDGYPALVNDNIVIQYQTNIEKYLINYYPSSNIGSNPTVNFIIREVEVKNELFLITVTGSGADYVSDKTYDEIKSAYDIGCIPIVKNITHTNNHDCYMLENWSNSSSGTKFKFGAVIGLKHYQLTIDSNNVIGYIETTLENA